jgi:hypothetical protein
MRAISSEIARAASRKLDFPWYRVVPLPPWSIHAVQIGS